MDREHLPTAQYVVFPKTNEDVSQAIKYSKELGVELAVCGGGHSWSGASSTKGLLIHLGKYMNEARCDPDARLLYVGGGALWSAAEKAAIEHGLATVAGTVNETGVGGLTLGGGFGLLSGRHGLVIDNLVECTVVLASGEVVKASETENVDLFWGLRGGGCNFGVVTEFVLRVYPQRSTAFFTRLIFKPDQADVVAEAAEKWYETIGPDELACVLSLATKPTMHKVIVVMYFYNGTPDEAKKAAKIFYDLGPMHEVPAHELPFIELGSQQQMNENAKRKYFKGLTIPKFTGQMISKTLEWIDRGIKTYPDLVTVGMTVEYIPKAAILKVPSDKMAFAGRRPGREILMFSAYTDPESDPKVRDEVRRLAATLEDIGRVTTGHEARGYANYDPEPNDIKDSEVIFGDNYPRLKELKRKYDPEMVFRKWFPITPADA